MSNNGDRAAPTTGAPCDAGSLDPDDPALRENADAGFGEAGEPVADEQAGLGEADKLDEAVEDLARGKA